MSMQRIWWVIVAVAVMIAGMVIYQLVRVGDELSAQRTPSVGMDKTALTRPDAIKLEPASSTSATEPTLEASQVSRAVGIPLREALNAAKNKNWALAGQWLTKAEAVPNKTAFEEFKIHEVWIYVLSSQKRYGELLDQYLALRNRPDLIKYANEHTKGLLSNKELATLSGLANRTAEAVDFAKQAVAEHPADDDAHLALIKTYHEAKQYEPCFINAQRWVDQQLRDNRMPSKASLILLQQCAVEMSNAAQITRSLRLLCQYYPSQSYWNSYLNRLKLSARNDLAIFYLEYLQLETGKPNSSDIYSFASKASFEVSFIETRAKTGSAITLPNTGTRVLLSAFANNMLDQKVLPRAQTLLARLQSQTSDAALQLPKLEKDAADSPTAINLYKLGMSYFDINDYKLAAAKLRTLIDKYPKSDERLSSLLPLGIAQLKSGDTQAARATFAIASVEPTLAPTAEAWATRSYNDDIQPKTPRVAASPVEPALVPSR